MPFSFIIINFTFSCNYTDTDTDRINSALEAERIQRLKMTVALFAVTRIQRPERTIVLFVGTRIRRLKKTMVLLECQNLLQRWVVVGQSGKLRILFC